jgi:hypothetical protein
MKVRVIRVFRVPDCDTRITRNKFGFCKLLPEIPKQNSGFGYFGFGFGYFGYPIVIPELPEINSGFASCYPKFPNKIRVSGISGSGSGSGISGSGFGLRVFCPALTAGGTDDLVDGETFSGCHHLNTDDGSHLPTNTAPASGGRPKAHRQVLTPVLATRMRTGPSQNTSTALTAYDVLCSRWRREGMDMTGPHTAQPTPVRRTGSHAPPQRWEVAPKAAPEPLRPRSQTHDSCQLPGRRTPLSPDR